MFGQYHNSSGVHCASILELSFFAKKYHYNLMIIIIIIIIINTIAIIIIIIIVVNLDLP